MVIQPNSPSSPVNPALFNLTPPVSIDTSGGNVGAMVAEMVGENSKLNKKAQPTEEQQTLAYIQQALSRSINSTDFAANMEFWESLKDSLPKDSPLLPFAEAQVNLFANNPALQKLQTQYGSDLKTLEDALSKMQSVENAAKDIQDQIDKVKGQISDVENDLHQASWYQFGRIFEDLGKLCGLGIELGGLYIALGTVKYAGEEAVKLIYNPDGAQTKVDADKAAVNAEKKLINSQSKNLNLESGDTASAVLNLAKQGNNAAQTELSQATGIAKLFAELSQSSKA
jgi:hypothetical protein